MKRIEYFISIPEAERIFGKEGDLSTYEFSGYYRLIRTACGDTSKYPDNSLSIGEIEEFLKTLSMKRRQCIRLRYWDCIPLRQSGAAVAISKERVRQIERYVLAMIAKRFSLEVTKTKQEAKGHDYKLPIERLNLSERCLNVLLRARLDTIEKVLTKSDDELLSFRMLGVACLKEIDEKLQRYFGLSRSCNSDELEILKGQLNELLAKNKQYQFKADITVLKFSKRTSNALKRAKIDTIGELLSKPDNELLKEKNLGVTCLKEIDKKLELYFGVGRCKKNYDNIRQKFAKFVEVGNLDKFDETIEILQLSTRPYKALKRYGINTVGKLLSKDRNYLLKLKQMGVTSVEEIRTKIYQVLEYDCFN